MGGYFSSLSTASWKRIVPMKSDSAFEKGKLLPFLKSSIDQGGQTEEGFHLLLYFQNLRNIIRTRIPFLCVDNLCSLVPNLKKKNKPKTSCVSQCDLKDFNVAVLYLQKP